MSTPSNSDTHYYFVPLGRERGGLLELLGLPPTASIADTDKKVTAYRLEAEKNFKMQCAELSKDKELDEKEREKRVAALKEEKTNRLAQLNEAKSKFDLVKAELLAHGGLAEDVVWHEILPLFADPGAETNAPVRMPGDYYEVLGLQPDADASVVARQEVEHRIEAEKKFKTRRKELREKLAAGELTAEELEAQTRQLAAERDEAINKLNVLKIEYRHRQEEREHEREQQRRERFWQFLLRPRPLSNVEVELLAAIKQRWIDAAQNGSAQLPDADALLGLNANQTRLPSQELSDVFAPLDLASLSRLVSERDLLRLHLADALWAKVPYTNRQRWSETVFSWAKEASGPAIPLRSAAVGAVATTSRSSALTYPFLSQPTDLTIQIKTEMTLPIVDSSVTEGVINKWLKRVGEWVEVDEPMLEFTMGEYEETKLVSHVSGRLAEIRAEEGKPIEPTTIIAVVVRRATE